MILIRQRAIRANYADNNGIKITVIMMTMKVMIVKITILEI